VILAPGDYDLAIDGFGSASGAYSGTVTELQPPPTCFLDPPCVGDPEGEPCDELGKGGGCSSTLPLFDPIVVDGNAVCGTNWGNNGSRDTDWWLFEVTVVRHIDVEVRAEADTVSFLAQMSDGGQCPVAGIPDGVPAFSGSCDTVHIVGDEFVLDPGFYIAFVGTGTPSGGGIFDGFPCPDGTFTNNEYELEVRSGFPPPPPCAWDLNMNGQVDFADILQIIGNWGPCPTG
jgi:hypothetical protein